MSKCDMCEFPSGHAELCCSCKACEFKRRQVSKPVNCKCSFFSQAHDDVCPANPENRCRQCNDRITWLACLSCHALNDVATQFASLRARIAELEGAIKRVQSHTDYGSVAFKIADEALRGGK